MKKTSRGFLALIMAALFAVTLFGATGALAQDKATPAAKKPTAHREKAGTITATIQAIDLEKRIVTVKGATAGGGDPGDGAEHARLVLADHGQLDLVRLERFLFLWRHSILIWREALRMWRIFLQFQITHRLEGDAAQLSGSWGSQP